MLSHLLKVTLVIVCIPLITTALLAMYLICSFVWWLITWQPHY